MAESAFLAGVAEATRAELAQQASLRVVRRGETLFVRGDAPRNLYLVIAGKVKIWRALEGGGIVSIAVLGRGQIVGALAVARATNYPANVTVLGDGEVVAWPLGVVRGLLARDPVLSANLLRVVVRVTEGLIDRVDEISAIPVQQRVARVLLRAAGEMDEGTVDDGAELRLSRQDIAELASTTLHTVSRIMSGWVRDAMIGGGRGKVVLRDLAALAHTAGLPPEYDQDDPR